MIKNLELYKVFYYVARTGSLTGAAKELSISQPAVSQSMKQLEKQLGVKLFTRVSKGVRLSAEGELLFSYTAKGYETLQQGEERLRGILDLKEGNVVIGATDYAIKYEILPKLSSFHTNYPNVKVTLTPMSSEAVIEALCDDRIDFGFSEKEPEGDSVPKWRAIRQIRDIFVAGSDYTYLGAPNLPYQLITHIPFIGFPEGSVEEKHISAHLRSNGLILTPSYTGESADLILQHVLLNLGVACLPEEVVEGAEKSDALIRLQLDPSVPVRYLYLLTDPSKKMTPAATAMLALFDDKEND